MTRLMRSRFRDEIPPAPPEQKPPGAIGPALIGNAILAVAIAGFGLLAVSWLLNDISGEYQGMDPQLGVVQLTVLRKPSGVKGKIAFARGASLPVSHGTFENGRDLDLTFEQPKAMVDTGMPARKVTFSGTVENGVIKGTLEESGFAFQLTLFRNNIASLYRQIQSHLPWAG